MTVISSRHRVSGAPRPVRAALATLALVGLLLVSACGMDAQTLKPYTPAEGIGFDVGDAGNPDAVVHVRNLLIISRGEGAGIVSASIVTSGTDALTGVTGAAYKVDGTKGSAFTAQLPSRILLSSNSLVVLTDEDPLITISAPDLTAGLDAEVTLQLGRAGSYTTKVPVVDGNVEPYTSITPGETSPSGTVTPTS